MKYPIPFLFFFIWGLWAHGQNIHQDIEKINSTYKKFSYLEMKSEYRWYETESSLEPIETLNGVLAAVKK